MFFRNVHSGILVAGKMAPTSSKVKRRTQFGVRRCVDTPFRVWQVNEGVTCSDVNQREGVVPYRAVVQLRGHDWLRRLLLEAPPTFFQAPIR